jgi:hypothetical protein
MPQKNLPLSSNLLSVVFVPVNETLNAAQSYESPELGVAGFGENWTGYCFSRKIPICCVNLREMSDESIRALRGAMLLQKVLLAFKHAYDRDFWLQNFQGMFIRLVAVGGNEPDETRSRSAKFRKKK